MWTTSKRPKRPEMASALTFRGRPLPSLASDSDPFRQACARVWAVLVLSIGLAGCGPLVHLDDPSPEGPRISHLRFVPSATQAGCPVNAKFRLDTAMEDIVSARCAWVQRHGRRAEYGGSTLPLDFDARRAGHEEEVEALFTPSESGTYYYYVQVGDRSGRLSNVLRGTLPVEHRWTEPAPPCPAGE